MRRSKRWLPNFIWTKLNSFVFFSSLSHRSYHTAKGSGYGRFYWPHIVWLINSNISQIGFLQTRANGNLWSKIDWRFHRIQQPGRTFALQRTARSTSEKQQSIYGHQKLSAKRSTVTKTRIGRRSPLGCRPSGVRQSATSPYEALRISQWIDE